MRELEPLAARSSVERLLHRAPAAEVRAELDRLDAVHLEGLAAAARFHARGALALREGELDRAVEAFAAAAPVFEAGGDAEAADLARCEGWLAAIRRGPRAVYDEARRALDAIAAARGGVGRVAVVALHYRGTAERFAGDAVATQRTLLAAFAASEGLLAERAQI